MVENTCFICLNEIKDDIHHFDESELAKMSCDCYKHKRVHSQCFNKYLKKKTENKEKCAVCRSSILDKNMLLLEACKDGKTENVTMLLEKGADVNAEDDYGITALMCASENGHTEIVSMLLEKGADVNAECDEGRTALMWASVYGHTEIVSMLLEVGADVNAEDDYGITALTNASEDGHTEIVSMLLEKGAEIGRAHV